MDDECHAFCKAVIQRLDEVGEFLIERGHFAIIYREPKEFDVVLTAEVTFFTQLEFNDLVLTKE